MADPQTGGVQNNDMGTVDWSGWSQRWDAQQTTYLPDREGRFTAMLDALDILLPELYVALMLTAVR